MGKDKVAAGVSGKSPKAGMVDPKGAWTKVQERTLAKNGKMIKKAEQGRKVKDKGLPPAGRQRPVDFEPKSKYPVTKGGGDNYDETIKREKENKKKGIMKMGGMMKKAEKGGAFPDLTGDGKVTQADVLKGRGVIKKNGGAMKKCKYGCK